MVSKTVTIQVTEKQINEAIPRCIAMLEVYAPTSYTESYNYHVLLALLQEIAHKGAN